MGGDLLQPLATAGEIGPGVDFPLGFEGRSHVVAVGQKERRGQERDREAGDRCSDRGGRPAIATPSGLRLRGVIGARATRGEPAAGQEPADTCQEIASVW